MLPHKFPTECAVAQPANPVAGRQFPVASYQLPVAMRPCIVHHSPQVNKFLQ